MGSINLGSNGTITNLAVGGLPDNTVDNGTMADDTVGIAELSATGTASSSTYLRGDNTWAEAGGQCKAWCNFDGTGTIAIRDSFNVSSLTDRGMGEYTVNFATDFADDDFAFVGTAANYEGTNSDSYMSLSAEKAGFNVGYVQFCTQRLRFDQQPPQKKDPETIGVAVFR
tara:strand:+ start:17329 stop:17838 length:510 start_codon:yes stop_codon:yes gene_type:complete